MTDMPIGSIISAVAVLLIHILIKPVKRVKPSMMRFPEVPVILMSGYTEQDAFTRFGATGLAGFLQKPFSAEILGAKLGSALGLR